MNIRGDVLGLRLFYRWLGHLVLLAFICRALIPIGYMPDFAAVSEGSFKVVICTSQGSQMMQLDENGKKVPANPESTHHQPCAFSSATPTVAPLYLAEIGIEPVGLVTEVSFASVFEELPPVRAGPALGSRAPPHLS